MPDLRTFFSGLFLVTSLVACSNSGVGDLFVASELGPPNSGTDLGEGDIGDTLDVGDASTDRAADVPLSDVVGDSDTSSQWEEGESCYPDDPFATPRVPVDLVAGSVAAPVSVLGSQNGLLIVRAGGSEEEWGIYTEQTDRSGQNVVASNHIESLFRAETPVAVKVDGGFLVAYTVKTEPEPTLWLAVLDDEGAPLGEPTLVGAEPPSVAASAFVVLDGQPVLFSVTGRPGEERYRRIEISAAGEVLREEALDLGEGARGLTAAVSGDQIGLLWNLGPSTDRELRFATLSRVGEMQIEPVPVAAENLGQWASVHASEAGWTVVYGTNEDGLVFRAWMLQLDDNGVPIGVAREISGGSRTAAFPQAAWDGAALAVVWQENTGGDVAFTLVGPDGEGTGPSVVSETLESSLLPAVFWVGDRYVVTWRDWSDETGYVQRLAVSLPCE